MPRRRQLDETEDYRLFGELVSILCGGAARRGSYNVDKQMTPLCRAKLSIIVDDSESSVESCATSQPRLTERTRRVDPEQEKVRNNVIDQNDGVRVESFTIVSGHLDSQDNCTDEVYPDSTVLVYQDNTDSESTSELISGTLRKPKALTFAGADIAGRTAYEQALQGLLSEEAKAWKGKQENWGCRTNPWQRLDDWFEAALDMGNDPPGRGRNPSGRNPTLAGLGIFSRWMNFTNSSVLTKTGFFRRCFVHEKAGWYMLRSWLQILWQSCPENVTTRFEDENLRRFMPSIASILTNRSMGNPHGGILREDLTTGGNHIVPQQLAFVNIFVSIRESTYSPEIMALAPIVLDWFRDSEDGLTFSEEPF